MEDNKKSLNEGAFLKLDKPQSADNKPNKKQKVPKQPRWDSGKELEVLKQKIIDKGLLIRDLKQKLGTDNVRDSPQILAQVVELLVLKQRDPDWNLPPTNIKIRWKVTNEEGEEDRHQFQFPDRTSIFGREVAAAIKQYSTKKNKFPNYGGACKIEIVERINGKKIYRALQDEDEIFLPLVWPGPVLDPVHAFQFRVTYAAPESHFSKPADDASYQPGVEKPFLVDVGVNLFDKVFKKNIDKVVRKGFSNGVSQMVGLAIDLESTEATLALAEKYKKSIFGTAGVHPNYVENAYKEGIVSTLKKIIVENPQSIVAIGECGLDYKRVLQKDTKEEEDEAIILDEEKKKPAPVALENKEKSSSTEAPKPMSKSKAKKEKSKANKAKKIADNKKVQDEKDAKKAEKNSEKVEKVEVVEKKPLTSEELIALQKKCFIEHLELAVELKKPLIVHERMAFEDTIAVLKNYVSKIPYIVINCFTGPQEQLDAYLNLGPNVYIVLTGIIGNADRGKHLQDLVPKIPKERLFLGTDAPYLTPYNMGKPFPRYNEPMYLAHVLSFAAKLYKTSSLELSKILLENVRKVFALPKVVYDGTGSALKEDLPVKPAVVVPAKEEDKEKGNNKEKEETPKPEEPQKVNKNFNMKVLANAENMYEFGGKLYEVTPKEKAVLEKQREKLTDEQFAQLIKDFDLKPTNK